MKVAGTFVQVCVKTLCEGKGEGLRYHPTYLFLLCNCAPLSKKEIRAFARNQWLAGSSVKQRDRSCCALCSC